MNGAKIEPWANTKSEPIRTRINTMGKSHNFFLTLKKINNSLKKFILIKIVTQMNS